MLYYAWTEHGKFPSEILKLDYLEFATMLAFISKEMENNRKQADKLKI
ncbi:MAG: hypothetical protein LBQ80_04180 [Clostridium sp.]|nr:hypothetical protein [Clostridium sp.]